MRNTPHHAQENNKPNFGNVLIILGWSKKDRKVRLLWAIEFLKKNPSTIQTIVLSGWKTAGDENPSEAMDMKKFLEQKIKQENISHVFRYILEEESCDTEDNAEKTKKLLEKWMIGKVYLCTNEYHAPRAIRSFVRNGIAPSDISPENELRGRSNHHSKFVYESYEIPSIENIKRKTLEIVLAIMSETEMGRKKIRNITQKRIS